MDGVKKKKRHRVIMRLAVACRRTCNAQRSRPSAAGGDGPCDRCRPVSRARCMFPAYCVSGMRTTSRTNLHLSLTASSHITVLLLHALTVGCYSLLSISLRGRRPPANATGLSVSGSVVSKSQYVYSPSDRVSNDARYQRQGRA
jgi:hypothetical protein